MIAASPAAPDDRPADGSDNRDEPVDKHAWERPGAHEVGRGVFRVPLPLPGDALRAVNVYVIVDGDRLVLVDGGWAMDESTRLLGESLDSIGFGLRDVREFLVTHVHRDHYTNAVAVRRITGARVGLGEGERAALESINDRSAPGSLESLRKAGATALATIVAGWNADVDLADWESPDHWLDDGVEFALQTRTLRVIATPGHTAGHVVFVDESAGALFAGDHVLPHITPSIGVEPRRPPSPLRDFLTSLQLVRALPDARLLPAHGPVTSSVHARVDELLAHHERRLDDTYAAVAAGASTGWEVAGRLGWTRRARRLDELDVFNRVLAVNETMAHLTVLVEQGRVTRTSEDGVLRYTAR